MNMQDKEIRAQSRAICEAATPGEWTNVNKSVRKIDSELCAFNRAPNGYNGGICNCLGASSYQSSKNSDVNIKARNNAQFIAHARTALPAALDYIERLEREVKIALKTCPNGGNDGYITPRPCQCEVEAIESDRDCWKARAEALERALGKQCKSCIHFKIGSRGYGEECKFYNPHTDGCHDWTFNQARFSNKPTQCQSDDYSPEASQASNT